MTIVTFEIAERPCGARRSDGGGCPHLLEAGEGYFRCPAGHLTFCRGVETPDSAHVTAQTVWYSHGADDRTTQHCATHRPDGSIKLQQRFVRSRVDLKYGPEPLSERAVAYTGHARRQIVEEGLTSEDVRSALLRGVVWQKQPGKVRVCSSDGLGREVHVVWRLNRQGEIVIIASFVLGARAEREAQLAPSQLAS